jgi:hypothetical protein
MRLWRVLRRIRGMRATDELEVGAMVAVLLGAHAGPSIVSVRGEEKRSWGGMKKKNHERDRDHVGFGDNGNMGCVSRRDTRQE